jgi:hypothetical protein
MRNRALRLAILFGWIPLAFLIAVAAHSEHVFAIAMAIGLVVSIMLRFTLLR